MILRIVLAGAAIAAAPLAAQVPGVEGREGGWHWSFWGTAAQEIVQSRIADTHERLTGSILSGEGVVSSDRLLLRVRYGQGTVSGDDVELRELVEGEVLLGFRAASWLTLWAGPNARAYASENTDQRWLFWSGRATVRGTLLPSRMQTFVELWQSVSGSVTLPDGAASGRGVEGGLDVRLSGPSLWGRVAYRIEQGAADGALRETVETLALSIAYVPAF